MLMHQNLQGRLVITPFTGCLMPPCLLPIFTTDIKWLWSVLRIIAILICHFGAGAHNWFQKRLSVPQLSQILRRGDVISSPPS